jgi:hypothetical protein
MSIGTGAAKKKNRVNGGAIGWNDIIDTVISSTTDTESVHHWMKKAVGPKTTYIRYNPALERAIAIDDTSDTTLKELLEMSGNYFDNVICTDEHEKRNLIRALRMIHPEAVF